MGLCQDFQQGFVIFGRIQLPSFNDVVTGCHLPSPPPRRVHHVPVLDLDQQRPAMRDLNHAHRGSLLSDPDQADRAGGGAEHGE